jgi:hypothetical protein
MVEPFDPKIKIIDGIAPRPCGIALLAPASPVYVPELILSGVSVAKRPANFELASRGATPLAAALFALPV